MFISMWILPTQQSKVSFSFKTPRKILISPHPHKPNILLSFKQNTLRFCKHPNYINFTTNLNYL